MDLLGVKRFIDAFDEDNLSACDDALSDVVSRLDVINKEEDDDKWRKLLQGFCESIRDGGAMSKLLELISRGHPNMQQMALQVMKSLVNSQYGSVVQTRQQLKALGALHRVLPCIHYEVVWDDDDLDDDVFIVEYTLIIVQWLISRAKTRRPFEAGGESRLRDLAENSLDDGERWFARLCRASMQAVLARC